MKALIIYDDFASAAKANAALQNSARNVDFVVQWNVNPWRIDMLKFPPTAEEALTDALDAHLIVIAGRSEQSRRFLLQGWLEQWAKCRQIKGAALALFGVENSEGLAAPAISEFASRHGLSLIFDDGQNGKDQSNIVEHSLDDLRLLASVMVQPILDEPLHHPHQRWGINE